MKADHVIIDSIQSRLECRHCGATEALVLPMEIMAVARVGKKFLAAHHDCPAPQPEADDVHEANAAALARIRSRVRRIAR